MDADKDSDQTLDLKFIIGMGVYWRSLFIYDKYKNLMNWLVYICKFS